VTPNPVIAREGRIAYQGEPGANSHMAAAEAYPEMDALPCRTFEDALAAIASGEAALGMIPIENSANGRVTDIHHLMPNAGLHIVGEFFMPIHHQLVGVRGAGLAFDGLYYVKRVDSSLKAGEFRQQFSLARNGLISTLPLVPP